jgi:hypothetical protein
MSQVQVQVKVDQLFNEDQLLGYTVATMDNEFIMSVQAVYPIYSKRVMYQIQIMQKFDSLEGLNYDHLIDVNLSKTSAKALISSFIHSHGYFYF